MKALVVGQLRIPIKGYYFYHHFCWLYWYIEFIVLLVKQQILVAYRWHVWSAVGYCMYLETPDIL